MNILHHAGLFTENVMFPFTAVAISGNIYHTGGMLAILMGVLNIIAVVICEINNHAVSNTRSTIRHNTKKWDYKYLYAIPISAFAHNIVIGIETRLQPKQLSAHLLIIGVIISIASKAIRLWALLENPFLYPSVSVHENQYVCTTGPYSYVRHPFYFSCLLYYIGICTLFKSTYGFLYIVYLFYLYYSRLLKEEATLAKELKGYEQYASQVHSRIIPMII